MSRRTRVDIAILAVLGAAIVVLFLNYLEVDDFPPSATVSEPDRRPSWLPPVLFHPCAWCELCPHRFEMAENRISITVTDRDGWYRLFWSAPETYTYDDPADLAAALRNKTAEFTGGRWTIRGRYVPVDHPERHPCPAAVDEVNLTFRLIRGPFPGPAEPAVDATHRLIVPTRMFWFRFPLPGGNGEFWWELENPAQFADTKPKPCRCSEP